MHDFCFTIPYGLIVMIGGVVGYLKKGSVASLGGGVGSGFLLILAGYLSLKAFEKRKNSYFALILETVSSAALTWVMGQRYLQTSKIMPAGVVAGISALMTAFYLFKIATGGNHIPAKAE
ncbi:protein FATTY ACID EXPORT 5-like [Humulus lupulus]|uniref:protein FATTY ACID EXPORT 5-like n=1 Tax=Humulus lupulus TaxID=3486 RepID=UPI002B40A57E|nr:protein FATTY ACID EXPORT 5-like [Humulus lupulus]